MPWHKDENMRDFSLLEVNKYVCVQKLLYNVHFLTTTTQEHHQYTRVQQGNTCGSDC